MFHPIIIFERALKRAHWLNQVLIPSYWPAWKELIRRWVKLGNRLRKKTLRKKKSYSFILVHMRNQALLFGLEKTGAACHQYKERGCRVIQVNHHKPHSILQEKFGQWSWWSQAASGIVKAGDIRSGRSMCLIESMLHTLQVYES